MVAACAETVASNVSAAAIGIHLGVMGGPGCEVFGMLLVALENLETSLQHD